MTRERAEELLAENPRINIESECNRRRWQLVGPRPHRHPEQSNYLILAHEDKCVGRGDTPHAAFLDACEREGVTPF